MAKSYEDWRHGLPRRGFLKFHLTFPLFFFSPFFSVFFLHSTEFFHLYPVQLNTTNRQIIVQPKSIVTSALESGTTTQSLPENIDDPDHLQYSNLSTSFRSSIRPSKKLPTPNIPATTNLLPSNSNPSETVNVVFRAPVVSSSSNQSMRPPPPPPPKMKGHSEEPSSSIPDLGKRFSKYFLSFEFVLSELNK